MPIRVFEYGLGEPTTRADLDRVVEQMHKAHVYRNLLTEMERARRLAVHETMAAHPDMAPLEARLADLVTLRDEARQAISTARGATRSRSETPQMRARAADLGRQIRETRALIKDQRKAVTLAVKPQLEAIEEAHRQRIRDARAVCGVYWGTYLLQESDADRARQEIFPPKFRGWRGEGRVSVQLQQGVTIEEMFGDHTQLHIDAVHDTAHDQGARRGDRRRARRTNLWLRVGSDAQRRPIWAQWPLVYHRPLPPGTRVKIATVSRRRHDCRSWDWRLHLTVEIPDEATRAAPAEGVIALNLGFCQRPDGTLRAGYMVGDDGTSREILLPRSVIDAMNRCDGIRSVRDKNMDAMKAAMSAWLATLRAEHEKFVLEVGVISEGEAPSCWGPAWDRVAAYIALGGPALPAWFAERAATLHAWRSADRFRAMAFRWRANRFACDEEGFRILEGGTDGHNGWRDNRDSWRHRDEHLERYESGMRRRALLRRRETYRIIAARVQAQYRIMLLDDTDLRDFQRSPVTESSEVEITPVKRNRGLVAGSELRLVMVNAFGPDRVVKGKPSTVRCHACGTVNDWDRRDGERMHTCSACGKPWDQDENACKNMIQDYYRDLRAQKDEPPPEAAPARLSRSARLRKARTRKVDESATAVADKP